MRIASGVHGNPDDEWLRYVVQMGAEGVVLHAPDIPGDARWECDDLLALRLRIESFGLEVVSIENTPFTFYDKAVLGLPGTDEQIEHYQATVRALGRAGITNLGFCWMPNLVWSSSFETPLRGGAKSRSFDLSDPGGWEYYGAPEGGVGIAPGKEVTHGRRYSEDEIWATFEYFMKAVLPVAEEAGVRLCLHPDDPPVAELGGIGRAFRNLDAFKRVTTTFDSPSLALNFCMGTWSEMGPVVLDAINYFVPLDKIAYMHFRDVQGHVPCFQECFLGEGNVDIVEVVATLKRLGYDGFVEEDHVPAMEGDTPWGHRARALTSGYIQGVRAAVDKLT